MRSSQSKSGFSHICNSERGGGQGNALTGLIFVLTIDRALKDTEAHFPGIKVKAIHDDITLIGPPEIIFGEDNSMEFLEKRLKLQGLTVNRGKCAVLGTTPDACKDKPDWLTEPTTIMDKDGWHPRSCPWHRSLLKPY